MPRWSKLALLCFYAAVGLLAFCQHGSCKHKEPRSPRRAGARILTLQHKELHDAPACSVDDFHTVVSTVRDEDGHVRLGTPPRFYPPLPGRTLEKEATRSSFNTSRFVDKAGYMVEQGGAKCQQSMASANFLMPRQVLMMLFRWVVLDREFAGRAWYERMKSLVHQPVLLEWTSADKFGSEACLAASADRAVAGKTEWTGWKDYSQAFERLAAPGKSGDHHQIVKLCLRGLEVAVYTEVDAANDVGEPVELKTVSSRNEHTFFAERMLPTYFQLLFSNCKSMCLGVINRGMLMEVKELTLTDMSSLLTEAGDDADLLLGRLAAALMAISETCAAKRRDEGFSGPYRMPS